MVGTATFALRATVALAHPTKLQHHAGKFPAQHAVERHGQVVAEAGRDARLEFHEHALRHRRNVEFLRGRDRQPGEFHELRVGMNDALDLVHD